MGQYVIKLPDVGEGLAEAELVQWSVAVGDTVAEDDIIAAVMTDKATVDIPSPVAGTVLALGAQVGDVIAIGAELIRLEVAGTGNSTASEQGTYVAADADSVVHAATQEAAAAPRVSKPVVAPPAAAAVRVPTGTTRSIERAAAAVRRAGEKPLAAPSVRRRAQDAGIDLRQVAGSGPAGRILHEDIDNFDSSRSGTPVKAGQFNESITEVKVVGLRRKIAEKMVLATSRIPHITYVEEVDMTKLEELRATLNAGKKESQARLTILPFLMQAMVKAIGEQPGVNALFDDDAGIIRQFGGVHIGIATQTADGLMVPVLRHAETMNVWQSAAELTRLADAARDGSITRDELTGSTITITSLGAIGGLVTTPVINHPEVAIIGVNKMVMRPMWDGKQFVPRQMMNISASFDHRIVDGWNAATFVQKIRTLLETPAMIFMAS